eukprot:4329389-Pleurochrysis_carterae.AAC.2
MKAVSERKMQAALVAVSACSSQCKHERASYVVCDHPLQAIQQNALSASTLPSSQRARACSEWEPGPARARRSSAFSLSLSRAEARARALAPSMAHSVMSSANGASPPSVPAQGRGRVGSSSPVAAPTQGRFQREPA